MISEKLRNIANSSFGKKALPAIAAFGIATMPFATANADTNDVHAQPVAHQQQEIRVPMNDARGVGEDAIQMSAAIVSKDAQVIVFFGDNYEAYKATVQAAQEIIAEGELPLRGIIIADPLTPEIVNGYQISGSQEIELYADGQLTDTIENPSSTVTGLIKQRLQEDYDRIIAPRRALVSDSQE